MNNNSLQPTMCNRRTISEAITGPATDALERSLKRPRTEKKLRAQHEDTTFYFPDLYNDLVATVDGSDEAFPSISWNFDEDSDNDDYPHTSSDSSRTYNPHSFLKCNKEAPNALQRSKSFRTNLADMNEKPHWLNQRVMFESNLEPIRLVEADEGMKIFTCISKPVSFPRGVDSNPLSQNFLTKIQNQDCVERLQHSLGLDIL